MLDVRSIPVLSDNYIHLAHCTATGITACIDPAVGGPVIEYAKAQGWTIDTLLITHTHHDHIGGINEIVQEFGTQVYGNVADQGSIPHCKHPLVGGDEVQVGDHTCVMIEVPGHMTNHVAYYFEQGKALFPGDTLFSLGCGRLSGGTAPQLWNSLQKLRALPADTRVYCAHEYTNANADFALHVDGQNADLIARAGEVLKLREAGQPTIPSLMESEIRCNPFMRCDIPSFKETLGMAKLNSEAVFTALRRQKDSF